ncbi:hypothetical protein CAPTEDRAFT_213394 [Capitella teleta]|uniref:DUF389 domain-containing protein n=1 Tax=Capitella teleta TaxID=283909 RepID=R7UPH3_CAPTE|nr:hypothetical protein CAPTEDRAFT_213394 [Capitella teleta]|eukprot:ELU08060.1 hypothetical protein CAPTEDRAFT_213394 [Capitella teleta]
MAVLFVIYIPIEDPDSPSVIRQHAFEDEAGEANLEAEAGIEKQSTSESSTPPESDNAEGETGAAPERSSGADQTALDESSQLLKPDTNPDDANPDDVVVQPKNPKVKFIVEPIFEGEEKKEEPPIELDELYERITLEQALQSLLESLDISNDTWSKTDDGNQWKVVFLVETVECDRILNRLTHVGFGILAETSISASPGGDKSDFFKSVKSRLTVAQVVVGVQANSLLTFDFVMLVILARCGLLYSLYVTPHTEMSHLLQMLKLEKQHEIKAKFPLKCGIQAAMDETVHDEKFIDCSGLSCKGIIAAMGLAENSSVVLVASMLVSPIMGPILGGTFGLVIKHRDLCRLGVTNELIGLSICLVVGFIFGLITAAANANGAFWGSTDTWPTAEMSSRGMLRSLWVGVLIALPSGAGVALSILGGNAGSLVGVAISASLLPPAVNAGMLWAYALVTAIHPPDFDVSLLSNQSELRRSPPNCLPLVNNEYTLTYSCDMSSEAGILGVVSLVLTLLNIICIFIMCVIVLKVKEVAPHTAMSSATEAFWKTDLKVAREAYKTLKGGKESLDMARMAKEMAQEWKTKQADDVAKDQAKMRQSLRNLISYISSDSNYLLGHCVPGSTNQPDLLKEVSKVGDDLLSDTRAIHRDHSYHTITTDAAVKEMMREKSSILPAPDSVAFRRSRNLSEPRHKRPPSSPASNASSTPQHPPSPMSPSSASSDGSCFVFDPDKLRKRPKKQRHPRGPSRLMSCPDSIHLPKNSSIGRFRVEPIKEEEPAEPQRRSSET